jgi:uncharacterized membrane protein
MSELFALNPKLFLFFHVLSAVVWIGGMIAVRTAVHPSMQKIEDDTLRIKRVLEIMKRLFNLVMPFIFILAFTGAVMSVAKGFSGTELGMFVHVKEGIWTLMFLNYGFMYYKRHEVAKIYKEDVLSAKKGLKLIATAMLPINIFLGTIAIFIGVMLRGI